MKRHSSTSWILLATLAVLFSGALSYVHAIGHHADHRAADIAVAHDQVQRATDRLDSPHAACGHDHGANDGADDGHDQDPANPAHASDDHPDTPQDRHGDCQLCLLLLTIKASSFDLSAVVHADQMMLEVLSVTSCRRMTFDRPGVMLARGPPQQA